MSNVQLRHDQAMAGSNGETLSWRVIFKAVAERDKPGPEGLMPCEICSPDP
jgi:hypothetical protein